MVSGNKKVRQPRKQATTSDRTRETSGRAKGAKPAGSQSSKKGAGQPTRRRQEQMLEEAQSRTAKLLAKNKQLEAARRQLAADLASSKDECTHIMQELEQERIINAQVAARFASLEVANQHLKQEAEEMREQMNRLVRDLADAAQENGRLSQSLQERQDREQALTQELERAEAEKKRLEGCLADLTAEKLRLEGELQEVVAAQQRLAQELDRAKANARQLEVDKIRLNQNLELEREDGRKKLRTLEQERNDLLSKLEKTEEREKQASRELDLCRSDKRVLSDEVARLEEKAVRVKRDSSLQVAKELAGVVVNVSTLANQEPEPVQGLTSRAVLEDLLDTIQRTSGERPIAFPAKRELAADHTLWLDPDQVGLETLVDQYDWSPDHPFEGLPEGQRRRCFRLLQRGWRIGQTVLARARVAPKVDEPPNQE